MLVDIIQKCIVINATLSDLYGGSPLATANRDISIQPFATSSILQHHYQATSTASSAFPAGEFSLSEHNKRSDNGTAGHNTQLPDSGDKEGAIERSAFIEADGGQVSCRCQVVFANASAPTPAIKTAAQHCFIRP